MIPYLKLNNAYWVRAMLVLMTLMVIIILGSQVQASINASTFSMKFLDDGTLVLSAQDVPLETILKKIQEKTNLKLQVHKTDLDRSISVNFRSLPLREALDRILQGVNYVAIFDSSDNVKQIITLAGDGKAKENSSHNIDSDSSIPYEINTFSPGMESTEGTMDIDLQTQQDEIINAMISNGITFPSIAAEYIEKNIGITIPSDLIQTQ